MTRRDWWLGVLVLALVLLAHALFPRYEARSGIMNQPVAFDRWTGTYSR